jgi:hypothetical protein
MTILFTQKQPSAGLTVAIVSALLAADGDTRAALLGFIPGDEMRSRVVAWLASNDRSVK